MSELESAIVVRIRVPASIDRVRRAHDRAARLGVPAHVTILYPFVPASELMPAIREDLRQIAGEFRAFDVTFTTAARWPGLVYLEPRPSSPFTALIDRVAACFPEHPPYAGAISEVIPHVTVVENDEVPLDVILSAAQAALPFEGRAEALDVLAQTDSGRWRRRWRIPFRP
ncbi:MAG TPA: 2'-5' RNA ligase family protein [Candidatus Limnocylindrales bacterium]|nr:2'-5' RNA ligase family protein [Candidatus Limnocylindrales bacterium]